MAAAPVTDTSAAQTEAAAEAAAAALSADPNTNGYLQLAEALVELKLGVVADKSLTLAAGEAADDPRSQAVRCLALCREARCSCAAVRRSLQMIVASHAHPLHCPSVPYHRPLLLQG